MWRFLVCSSLVALVSANVVYQRLTDCTDEAVKQCARDDDGWHGCKNGIGNAGNPSTFMRDGGRQQTTEEYQHLWLGGRAQHTIVRFRRVDYAGNPLTVRFYPSSTGRDTAVFIRALKRWDPARTAGDNKKLSMYTRIDRAGLRQQFSNEGKSLAKYMEDPNEYTEAKVLWVIPDWTYEMVERATEASTTPDLSVLAEEMLSLSQHPWGTGKPLAFVFTAAQCVAGARDTSGKCTDWEERAWNTATTTNAGPVGNATQAPTGGNKCETIQLAAGTTSGLRVYAFDGQSSKAAEVSAYGGYPDAAAQPVAIMAFITLMLAFVF